VDSISYYTFDLADCNKKLYTMQKRKAQIALTGNTSKDAENWLSQLMISANEIADQIMIDSAVDNSLRAAYTSMDDKFGVPIPQAELMASHYGSFGYKNGGMSPRTSQCLPYAKRFDSRSIMQREETPISSTDRMESVIEDLSSDDDSAIEPPKAPPSEKLLVSEGNDDIADTRLTQTHICFVQHDNHGNGKRLRHRIPGSKYDDRNLLLRLAGRIGLDFVVAGIKFAHRQLGRLHDTLSQTRR
jgi:hypothetical protein